MKRLIITLLLIILRRIVTTLFVLGVSAFMSGSKGAEPTADGIWELTDEGGAPEGWFRIAEKDGLYQGQIVRMFSPPGEDPAALKCTKCQDDRNNAPVLGITFIRGMKRKGLSYDAGWILDPRDGAEYHARMDLSADGQILSVRGYLAIEMLGQTQVWHRVRPSPETAKLFAQ